jgi:hypothetical protein
MDLMIAVHLENYTPKHMAEEKRGTENFVNITRTPIPLNLEW